METINEKLCTELGGIMENPPANDGDSGPPEAAVVSDGNTSQGNDDGNIWEQQLDTLKDRINELQKHYENSYLEIGKILIQARDIYKGHGNWLQWLKNNVPFTVRHAQRLIRVAEMFNDATLVSRLGLSASKAYILTKVGKNDIDHFLTNLFRIGSEMKSVKDMTRQELDFVVRRFLKGKLISTDHDDVLPNQNAESLKSSVEASVELNFKELKRAMDKAITSIRAADSDSRNTWISELEELYKTGLEQLELGAE